MRNPILVITGVWPLLLIFGCGDDTTSSPDGGGAGGGDGAAASDTDTGADSDEDSGDEDAGGGGCDEPPAWGECAPCAWECIGNSRAACRDGVHNTVQLCELYNCVDSTLELGWEADFPVVCRQQICDYIDPGS